MAVIWRPMVALLALAAVVGAACNSGSSDSELNGGGYDSIKQADLPIQMGPLIAGTFDQQIDHLSTSSGQGTFKQRYWYSTQFTHKRADAPVLFYLCGEAECSPEEVASLADVAKSLDAAVVGLEHRYYGKSVPFKDLTQAHMRYLTIYNALEDAAAFERFAKTNLPLAGKWISVGGSYPGMLSAFYREKHPELVVGAWASSAPVNVALSFWGYDAIAAQALGPTCTLLFQQALAYAGSAYDSPAQLKGLEQQLGMSDTFTSKADFLDSLSSIAESAAQYGYGRGLCAALQQESLQPIEGLIGYVNPPLVTDPSDADMGAQPDGGSADGGALDASVASADAGAGADVKRMACADASACPPSAPVCVAGQCQPASGARAPRLKAPASDDNFTGSEWFYQVCTEVGFYQVHNPARDRSVMSDLITEKYWNDQCLEFTGTSPAIAQTRAQYLDPLLAGQVTHLFFVNGSEDPWSSLSFTDQSTAPAGVTTLVVEGGSHCEDLQNLYSGSLLGVFQAHKEFHDLAVQWLSQP